MNICQCGCGAQVNNRFKLGHAFRKKRELPTGVQVDAEDLDRINEHRWYLNKRGYIATETWNPESKTRNRYLLHRFIMNAPSDKLVDHINGDPLDNRKSNLRVVDKQINCQNQHNLSRRNTSGYRGVSFDKSKGKWLAQAAITVGCNKRSSAFLGYYSSAEEANEAAKAWRLKNMEGATK